MRATAAGVGVNACAHRRESAIRGCPRRRAGVRHGRSGAWSLQAARVRELRAACPRADGDQSVTVTVSLCHCTGADGSHRRALPSGTFRETRGGSDQSSSPTRGPPRAAASPGRDLEAAAGLASTHAGNGPPPSLPEASGPAWLPWQRRRLQAQPAAASEAHLWPSC